MSPGKVFEQTHMQNVMTQHINEQTPWDQAVEHPEEVEFDEAIAETGE